MKGDRHLLQLPHIPLQTKELLPESSGIYYVLDQAHKVWYIGQAKNICKRWQGKTHHRIAQLEAQKKTHFTIYYELVSQDKLDEVEKQRIEKYHPHLNESPVKAKKVLPSETLLRETLVAISDFAFILGVEPPRKEIQSQLNKDWWTHQRILHLNIIHICIDWDLFKQKYPSMVKPDLFFQTRKAYANKWEYPPSAYLLAFRLYLRLYVNGYAIEAHAWYNFYRSDIKEELREYHQVALAGESFQALTETSLHQIQKECNPNFFKILHLMRCKPYNSDLIKVFFTESIEPSQIQDKFQKINREYKAGLRGFGSRSRSQDSHLSRLLNKRGIDTKKYNNFQKSIIYFRFTGEIIGLFVKSFTTDLKRPYRSKGSDVYNIAKGIIDNQDREANSFLFDTLYLVARVNREAWLLVEEYLQDFASVNRLANGVGYMEKFYVSPRKVLVPAKVNIKILEVGSGFGIPFGPSDDFPTFETAKEEIKRRLEASDLPEMKLTFQREKVT